MRQLLWPTARAPTLGAGSQIWLSFAGGPEQGWLLVAVLPRTDIEDEDRAVELLYRLLAGARVRTLEDWEEIFANDRNVFAELYRSGPEVLGDPQLTFDKAVVEIVDPERGPGASTGRVRGHEVDARVTAGPGPGSW